MFIRFCVPGRGDSNVFSGCGILGQFSTTFHKIVVKVFLGR